MTGPNSMSATGARRSSTAVEAEAAAAATTIEDRVRAHGEGRTQVADIVVSKIAGLATREISGVHALGGGTARALEALRERIPGATSNVSQGVAVEVGQRQTAVDLDIVVEYGVSIVELARAIRRNVIGAIERMTGLEVVEVNITVNDVHIVTDDDPARSTEVETPSARVS